MPKKAKHHIRNWPQYNKALVARGSLTTWVSSQVLNNLADQSTQKLAHGNQVYSDMLIELCLTLRQVYGTTLRGTQGLVQSIFKLMKIHASTPDYTTLSRRGKNLHIKLNARPSEDRVILFDSTGVQVIGGTEWKKIRHIKKGRQLWRKLHLTIDGDSQDICSALVSESQRADGNYVEPLLDEISSKINKIIGDGAYDKKNCYQAAYDRGATPVFPPQHNAIVQRNKIKKSVAMAPRDDLIRYLNGGESYEDRLKLWKRKSGYHQRSLVETTMSRLKYIFGDKVRSRSFKNQVADLKIRCCIINKINTLGLPDSIKI